MGVYLIGGTVAQNDADAIDLGGSVLVLSLEAAMVAALEGQLKWLEHQKVKGGIHPIAVESEIEGLGLVQDLEGWLDTDQIQKEMVATSSEEVIDILFEDLLDGVAYTTLTPPDAPISVMGTIAISDEGAIWVRMFDSGLTGVVESPVTTLKDMQAALKLQSIDLWLPPE